MTFSKVESKIFIVVLVNRGALWKKNVVRIENIFLLIILKAKMVIFIKCRQTDIVFV